MIPRLFIDSDIILDLMVRREAHYDEAALLFSKIEKGGFAAFTTALVFSNLYYILRKQTGHLKAIGYLKKLTTILGIMNVNETIVRDALYADFTDFEDAIQYYSSMANQIDYIVTRNVKDYKKSTIPVRTPAEINRMENESKHTN
jgi:predicted nucleic acid-binding protein